MRVTSGVGLMAVLAVTALLAVTGATAAEGDKLVLTVGLANDFDTLNPLVGVEVPDYDVWNLQYATLTDKAADDFATIPGLAESWVESNGGLTYTYTLREGLTWSDGEPLTAEDVAYNINRARDEEWLNYTSIVANLTAKVINERTVEITSRVPDPKLPTMDIYLVPKHIWEKQSAKAISKYPALDGVGSGPFVLDEVKRGQFWRMKANPRYWGGKPAIDEVVFRLFNNRDAMVASLQKGEIDAAHDVPSESFLDLRSAEGIVTVVGEQGGFVELALNGGQGLKPGNPALANLDFRRAIGHAIDKQTLVDKVWLGLARPGAAISPSPDPKWLPEIAPEEQLAFDLDKAKQILEDAGFTDTNGNGLREVDGKDIRLVYMVRSESETAAKNAEFITGWLDEIGIGTTLKPVSDSKLTEIIGKGEYDLFEWGWTPFVDPDQMLSYFRCNQLARDPDDPTNYYNDANWCSKSYDADYVAQSRELDPAKRVEIVHRMLRTFYDSAVYHVIAYDGDLQAYRTDRFTGWVRQPAGTGAVILSNTSPTYFNLQPVAATGGGGGDGIATSGVIGIVVATGLVFLAVGFGLGRRTTAYDRE